MNILVKNFGIVIPQYSKNHGIQSKWTDGFEIKTTACYNEVQISANREGLLSLANHLFNLVQDDVPCATHIHLDECNALKTVR